MLDAKTCALWAGMAQYQARVSNTESAIRDMLDTVKRPYIAFSCGKDSSVLADLVLRIDRRVPLRFISSGETRILHNVDTVLDYFRETYDAQNEEIMFDRVFSEEWRGASFDEQRKAGRRDIQRIDNACYDGVFMGLRIQESRGRAITLRYHKTEGLPQGAYKYAGREYYRLCPLARWTAQDVGAYLTEHDIPVLDWYRDFGFEGRTTARLTGDAVRQNTLFWLRQRNPEGYQRLMERFPELRVY